MFLLYLTHFQGHKKTKKKTTLGFICTNISPLSTPKTKASVSPCKYATFSDTLQLNFAKKKKKTKSNCYSQPQTVFCRLSDVSSEANMYAHHMLALVWAATTEALRHGLSVTEWIKDNERGADSLMGPLGIHKSPTWQHAPTRNDHSHLAQL